MPIESIDPVKSKTQLLHALATPQTQQQQSQPTHPAHIDLSAPPLGKPIKEGV